MSNKLGYLKQQRTVTRRVIDLVPNGSGGYRYEVKTSYPIETRELVHCNFGWGGKADGYYYFKAFDTRNGAVDTDTNDPYKTGNNSKSDWYVNTHYRMIKYTK